MLPQTEVQVKQCLYFPFEIPGYGMVYNLDGWKLFLAIYRCKLDAFRSNMEYSLKIQREVEYLRSLADPNFAWLDHELLDHELTEEDYCHDVG